MLALFDKNASVSQYFACAEIARVIFSGSRYLEKDMASLVYAVHNVNNYFIHTATSILSAIHCFEGEALDIHIIHDSTFDVTCHEIVLYLHDTFNIRITLHNFEITDSVLKNKCGEFSAASLYRYIIPRILDDDIVIYADSDIIFQVGFKKLLTYIGKYHDFCFGVVKDANVGAQWLDEYIRGKGLSVESYFNSGLIVFNRNQIKNKNIDIYKLVTNCVLMNEGLRYPDQDAFNALCLDMAKKNKDVVLYMPEMFSFSITRDIRYIQQACTLKGCNIHYAGIKPWERRFTSGVYYWKFRKALNSILPAEMAQRLA